MCARSIATPSIRSSNGCRGRPNSRTNGSSALSLRRAWQRGSTPRRRRSTRQLRAPRRQLPARAPRLGRQRAAGVDTAHRAVTGRRPGLVHRVVDGAAEVPHGDDGVPLSRRQHQERVVEAGVAAHTTQVAVAIHTASRAPSVGPAMARRRSRRARGGRGCACRRARWRAARGAGGRARRCRSAARPGTARACAPPPRRAHAARPATRRRREVALGAPRAGRAPPAAGRCGRGRCRSWRPARSSSAAARCRRRPTSVDPRIVVPGDAQDEPADRIGRAAAIVDQVVPGGVARRRDVLAERAEQILEQRHRQRHVANRRAEREKDLACVRRLAGRRGRTGAIAHRTACSRADQPSSRRQPFRGRSVRPRRRSRRRRGRTHRPRRCAGASRAAPATTPPGNSRSAHRRRARTGGRPPRPRRSPHRLGHTGAMVDGARHHEQQVGQPIEVDDDDRVDGAELPSALPRADDAALGAAADGARQVQQRAGRRAAWQDEAASAAAARSRAGR